MSKRKQRVIFFSSPFVIIFVLLIWGRMAINRLEANEKLLAQTGQASIKLLNEYRSGVDNFVAKKDPSKILDCYAENYLSDHEGEWEEKLQSNRDGVQVYEWDVENQRPFHKADVAEQVTRYLAPIISIEESKFKLDSVEDLTSSNAATVRGVLWLRGLRKNRATAKDEAFESHGLIRLWLETKDGKWQVVRQELIHADAVTDVRKGVNDL